MAPVDEKIQRNDLVQIRAAVQFIQQSQLIENKAITIEILYQPTIT